VSGRQARAAGAGAVAALALLAAAARHGDELRQAAFRAGTAAPAAARTAVDWWGGPTATSGGETVTVYVSSSYPQDGTLARGWADFFAGLVHGEELARVAVYVATPAEVESECGGESVLGCYGGGRLVVPGEPAGGVEPHTVAAHEYGHHVAASRDNAPWRAGDWGTKRWASYLDVCARTRGGELFPGDEGRRYELNPGEGFAEAYRVLNETRGSVTPYGWTLVDPSFAPDAGALVAIEDDVLHPWSGRTATTLRGRFGVRGPRVWRRTVTTPLDGDLDVRVRLPRSAAYDVDLLAGDGRTVVGRGLWSGTAEKSLRYTVCGQRSLVLRVTRRGPAGSVQAVVERP
jgi:hypothetical protein